MTRSERAQAEREAAREAAFYERDEDPRPCLNCGHRIDEHLYWECRICKCKNPAVAAEKGRT